ncbi:MAG: 2-C-methyl-D-erythritol 4-phosphate cytidylyltransferase, partial [Actinomycetes bacterium]
SVFPGSRWQSRDGCTVCEGGAERSFSVRNALAASSGPAGEAVLVHDAARPLLTGELIARMIDSIEGPDGAQAAVAAAPVTDTIRVADVDGSVLATPDRSTLRAMQTPQAFRREVLERALAQDDEMVAAATDDAALAEALGVVVKLIDSPPENLKVTTPTDIALAELLLAERGNR